jgi:16S rRNA (guanine527-N7)-methyltransferase
MTAGDDYRRLLAPHARGEILDRMVRYAELLERWSASHSLVRFASRKELVDRHLLDALAGRHLLGPRGVLIDVGSGAGLPGVPLLIASPTWSGVLLEPRQKRWAFLKMVIRELGLPAEAREQRTEAVPEDDRFDLVTVRAVGDHQALLAWARPRLTARGGVALWTTENGESELSQHPGWRVVSWPLVGLDRGRLVHLEPEPRGSAP